MPARFITLEGGEGTGKSTLQAALSDRLQEAGIDVVTTREPGGTPLAESIRQIALNPPAAAKLSPLAEALLMNAARADHLEKLIRPALAGGKWVICDRFADSTRAYQSVHGGVSLEVLKHIESLVLGQTRPDLTLILDAPFETTVARRQSRGGPVDSFESRPDVFHAAIRQAFIDIARDEPDRCRLLDASRPPSTVRDVAWTQLTAAFQQDLVEQ